MSNLDFYPQFITQNFEDQKIPALESEHCSPAVEKKKEKRDVTSSLMILN